MRGHGRETKFGLKPFCTDVSLKIGGKRTSGYLDVRSITLSEWLVRIWQTNKQFNDVNFTSRVVRRRED